ncbi:MAG: hypothetical protein GXP54_13900 [Deltaproteobacteria bacterium]|nr:hypothetical protein [Deltaproteobacteria bacterium]
MFRIPLLIVALAVVGCASGNGGADQGGSIDLAILDASENPEAGEITNDTVPEAVEDISHMDSGATKEGVHDIDATTDEVSDIGGDEQTDSGNQNSPFYPSPEMFLKILGPSSTDFASSAGSLTAVTGILFGEAEKITWTGPSGQGEIEPTQFWLSEAIELEPGDNLITVTATGKDGETSTDSIMVVYMPGFAFSGKAEARPDVVFVGEDTDVVFTLRLGANTAISGADVTLHETLSDMSPGDAVATMKDDGKVSSSGDEIPNDGVFTAKSKISCKKDGSLFFRIGVPVQHGITNYTAYSPPVEVECVSHLSASDCQSVLDVQTLARSVYDSNLSSGEAVARQAALDFLKGNAAVAEAGLDQDGYGLWAYYKVGVLGAVSLAPLGLRGYGVDQIASKKSYVFSPYTNEFGQDDETYALGQSLSLKPCPTYDLSGPHLGPQSTLQRWREAMGAGILAAATHGETFFRGLSDGLKESFHWSHKGSQEVLFAGEPVACGSLLSAPKTCSGPDTCPSGTECVITKAAGTSLSGVCVDRTQADIRRGRVAIGPGVYAMLPSFFERYGRKRMPDSLVYLGACRSVRIGTLAAAFIGAGARTVIGFSDYVSSSFAGKTAGEFFNNLVNLEQNVGDAWPEDTQDPDNPGRMVRIGSSSLSVSESNIVNQGFERGDLTGWVADGDGRVITKLGATGPVAGKFMGIISTGLGYTVQTGSIEQTFCIPAGTYGITFYWKFYSEEFHEWCGSQFQDTFTARVVNDLGQEMNMVDVSVDDLCDPGDCFSCCSAGKCVGLVPSDVQFDVGDTHVVPKWQRAKMDISQFAGEGPVTLSFFATDKGDSIYDTVILLDGLTFK